MPFAWRCVFACIAIEAVVVAYSAIAARVQ